MQDLKAGGVFIKAPESENIGGLRSMEHERSKKQHEKFKLSARERLDILLDPGSITEFNSTSVHRCHNFNMDKKKIPGDGVIIATGKINGRNVVVCSQDFTVMGGSLGEVHAKKINKAQDIALKMRCPIIFINDSGGARIQEGVDSLAGYGEIFQRNVDSSGVIPQIALIMGPCAGGAVYSPAIMDFTFMVEGTSYMYLTGPDVVKAVTHEDVTHDSLGGPDLHSSHSGACDLVFENEIDCLNKTRALIDLLPSSNTSEPVSRPTDDPADRMSMSLGNIIPDNIAKSYDVHHIISKIVDEGELFPIKENFAKNIVTCFAFLEGRTVGIVANQPMHLAGCLDINASIKASRFVRFCDAFSIPILTIVDVPGFLPGLKQEKNGAIRNGAKLLYAYAEATTPKVTLITRKAYGGAYIVMGSKHLGADINYSWQNTEIAVMGAKAAVAVLHKRDKLSEEESDRKAEEYKALFSSPEIAASRGFLDNIITPYETRKKICHAFNALRNKEIIGKPYKKHNNMPL